MNKKNSIQNNKFLFISLCTLMLSLPLAEVLKQFSIASIIIFGLYYIYNHKITIKKDIIFLSFLSLIVTLFISNLLSENILEAFSNSKYLIRLFFIFTVLSVFHYNFKEIKKILYFALSGYMIALLWVYYHYIENGFDRLFFQLNSIGHRNHSSIFMLYIFIVLISYIFYNRDLLKFIEKAIIYILSIVTLITIFLISSRASMYTSIGIISIMFLYTIVINKNYKIIYVLIPIVISMYFALEYNDISIERFSIGFYDPIRLKLFLTGLEKWYETGNYLFGLGAVDYKFNGISHLHNTYLDLLFKHGLIGLGCYLVFMLSMLIVLLKRLMNNKTNYLIIASILLWISNFIISFANTTFHHENALFLIIVWTIALNMNNKNSEQNL